MCFTNPGLSRGLEPAAHRAGMLLQKYGDVGDGGNKLRGICAVRKDHLPTCRSAVHVIDVSRDEKPR
jgi:hypothetical protein